MVPPPAWASLCGNPTFCQQNSGLIFGLAIRHGKLDPPARGLGVQPPSQTSHCGDSTPHQEGSGSSSGQLVWQNCPPASRA